MCLAIPAQIKEIDKDEKTAMVEIFGVRKQVALDLIDMNHLVINDYVLIHVGFALRKVDIASAKETLAYHEEIMQQEQPHES